jgi:hypothetical protein
MRGNLRHSTLAEVLRHLYAERKSGVLHVSREGIQKRVHFKKGVAIFADAADSRLLSRDQAESLMYSLFTWTSGEFSFEDLEPKVDEGRAFTASPSVMILEGSRRIAERQILEDLIGGSASVFACAQTSALPLFTMKLSPPESSILKFARERERFTARDLPFPSGTLDVVRALNVLVSVGLLEVVKKASVPARSPAPPPRAVPPALEPSETSPPIPAPPPPAVPPALEPSEASPPIPAPPPRGELENILDTFEAKRSAVPPPSSKPRLKVSAPPPVVEAAVAPAEPAPPRVESEAHPPRALEAQPEPPTPVEMPPTAMSREIPAGRRRWILGASLAIAAIAVVLGLSLSLRRDESPRSEGVVEADSAPPEPEPAATAPPPEDPGGQPETQTEPSDAELFYSANLAFESGDYERSKAELTALLERQPDLAAARELMARVQRELTPKPRVAEETRASRKVVEKPSAPELAPVPATAAPLPAELFEAARSALARSDLETARARLDALEAVHASYPGASKLQEELGLRSWERTLPLAFNVRHDHALGSCAGILHLTASGFSYRSKEHEWVWSFAEVTETERRDPSRLRIETTKHTSYNFELKERPSDQDWARHQALRSR